MKTRYIQIGPKGQIVIPAKLREELELEAGTKLSVQRDGQMLILCPITPAFIRSLVGITQGLGELREKCHKDDKDR
ncbi:AbrB/MazE/SpoVT family DNA-binding domain-containing protein [Candidatus Korobacter versatilis]|uniref:AbrB/MazE/SpoVT family DNA-binding domain-containing protein n=1 Tax=Candidatus Korobacter versatilis TaxID=658062 RepID=UPI0002E080C7|nr:AbrB/MazE/SpoVT family DNA-binding domain-containing protein [Candidatus Koribacter versatilis]